MSKDTMHFVLHSGGLDSSVLLHLLANTYAPAWVHSLSINYGQRHSKETAIASAFAGNLLIAHSEISLPRDLLAGHVLTDPDAAMPNASYEELPEGVSPTYVPFRNGMMLSLLAAFAQSYLVRRKLEHGIIYFGAHAEDAERSAYPDCTPEFAKAMAVAVTIGTYGMVDVNAPFIHDTKADIVRSGHAIGTDFAATWSCYKGDEFHCGTCPTCRARKGAFMAAGVADPTIYQEPGEV